MKIQEKDDLINIVFSNADLKAIKRADGALTIKTKTGKVISFISEDALAKLQLESTKLIRKPKKEKAE